MRDKQSAHHRRLKRLPREFYTGRAYVHWSQTIEDRKTGWLTPIFFYKFRELLTHTMFRYAVCCPMFCLMPDHFHMMWVGLLDRSDQLSAIKQFRASVNEALAAIESHLQDQSYDHVLKDEERQEESFTSICEYIARNPERAELVPQGGYADYKYTGCIIPGYPEMKPFEPEYWQRFWRATSHLRKTELFTHK